MKRILSKDQVNKIVEKLNYKVGDTIFIHHPITEDLITVTVKELKRDKILVSIPEDSPYLGQPDWYIPKVNIISVKKFNENNTKISCIITNWKAFQAQHAEWSNQDKNRYKNPYAIWQELNLYVADQFAKANTFPEVATIPYKTEGYEGDCIFVLQDSPDAQTNTPKYEYQSVVS